MPQTPYTPDADPLQAALMRAPLSNRARAALWDVYESSATVDDLASRLSSMDAPNEVKAKLWELKSQETAPVPKETQPSTPGGSALGRFASNAGEMINPISIAKGLYQTATHPIETGRAVLGQSAAQIGKAKEAFDQGRYVEAVGHGAGSIPIIGPLAAEAGEQIASGDVAGGLGKATGMLVPFGAAEGLARVGVRAAPAAAANKLDDMAASRYADVMSPKSSAAKGQRMAAKADKIAPEIAKGDNAAWSREGLLGNLQDRLSRAGTMLDEAADARNAGKPYDTKPITDALRAERSKLTAQPFDASKPARQSVTRESPIVNESGRPIQVTSEKAVSVGKEVVPHHNAAQVAELDKAIAELDALGPIAPYEGLRRIRASYDKPAEVKYSPAVTPDYLTNQSVATGAADVAGVIREALAKGDPVTAAANAEYSLYKNAVQITKAASELERSRPRVGRQIMARLTGTILGGNQGGTAGAVAGYAAGPVVDQLLTAGFTTKLQSAKLMGDLATAIRTGNVERASTLSFKIRQLAKQGEAVRARGSADQTAMPQPAQ